MKSKKTHLIISFSLIVLTVGFIWINSAIPGKDSGELSSRFSDILGKVLDFIHCPQGVETFLLTNIRKVAHAVEYAVIGLELAILWVGLHKGIQGVWNAWSTVLAIAVFDETIQLVATDRGPQITDVLLDTAGGTVSILIVYFCAFIIQRIRKSRKTE